MCLVFNVHTVELSKLTLSKECHSGIGGGKRSWKESEQEDKWQQQLLKPWERKQAWPVMPRPQSLAKGVWFQYQDLECERLASDYLGWSIRHWSNQEWRSKPLHLDEQGVQKWLGMVISPPRTSSCRRGAWVEPGTSSVWGNCVTELHPQRACFLSADAGRVREHTARGCALSEGYVLNPLPAPGSHSSHEDGDILCHGQWTVWPFTLLTSCQGSLLQFPCRQQEKIVDQKRHCLVQLRRLALSLCRPGSLTDVVRK